MMRFLPVNHGALMVELDDLEQTLALLASLKARPIPGVEELVPAARTMLVSFRPAACTTESLVQEIAGRDVTARAAKDGTLVRIPVHYDGEDIAEVAALMGIAPEELVRRHTARHSSVTCRSRSMLSCWAAMRSTSVTSPGSHRAASRGVMSSSSPSW